MTNGGGRAEAIDEDVPLFDCDEGEVSPLCSFGFVVNTT
jgi:hypothetical protein